MNALTMLINTKLSIKQDFDLMSDPQALASNGEKFIPSLTPRHVTCR